MGQAGTHGKDSSSFDLDLREFLILDISPFLGCRNHSDLQTAIRKLHTRVPRYSNMALHFHIRKPHAYIVVKIAYLALNRVYSFIQRIVGLRVYRRGATYG